MTSRALPSDHARNNGLPVAVQQAPARAVAGT